MKDVKDVPHLARDMAGDTSLWHPPLMDVVLGSIATFVQCDPPFTGKNYSDLS